MDFHFPFVQSRVDETVNFAATLFYSISIKPCRDRRPRRSEKKKRLLCVWLHTNSRLKSKICCFPDRRGRRSLQAKKSNRIDTPIRSENSIVSDLNRYADMVKNLIVGEALRLPFFCIDVCFSFGRGDPSPTKIMMLYGNHRRVVFAYFLIVGVLHEAPAHSDSIIFKTCDS